MSSCILLATTVMACGGDDTGATPKDTTGSSQGGAGGSGGEGQGGAGGSGGSGGACQEGDTQACYSGPDGTVDVGICAEGTQTCAADGTWGACTGDVVPDDEETCNGLDDDCDGEVDEDLGMQMCGVGACMASAPACENGEPARCTPGTPSAEQCDGIDNDCDGAVDNGNPGSGMACDTGSPGACQAGTTACRSGAIVCNPNVMPSPETCDAVDNDCNGATDDNDPGGGVACMTNLPGVCTAGTTTCSNGSIVCNSNIGPSPEACDGLDNDCNGSTDEGNPGGGQQCMTGLPGICAQGSTDCVGGAIQCTQSVQPQAETCDGDDDDCDGSIDNGTSGLPCITGLPGVCSAGTTQCNNGVPSCSQTTQPSNDVCGDALDNDCDGTVDEGCCGDGLLGPGETCDDGNQIDNDACTNACTLGPLVVVGNSAQHIVTGLGMLGESFSQPGGEYGNPSSQGTIIISNDGCAGPPYPNYNAHLNAGAHVLVVGGCAFADYTAWVSGYVNTDNTASWHTASCSPDWTKVGVHPITQFMPATHNFVNQSVSYHMLHFTAVQPADTVNIGSTCDNGNASVLVTRKFGVGGTYTYMALDIGEYTDATAQAAFVNPFLQGYLSYVRSPH